MVTKKAEKNPENNQQNGGEEESVGTTTIEEQEALAGQETIMPGEEPAVKTEPKLETKPEPELTEMQKLDELLKSVNEYCEKEVKFHSMLFPVVKSINNKSWWIIGFSVFTIILFFFLFNFISGKFSEQDEKFTEMGIKMLSSNNEVKVLFENTFNKKTEDLEKLKTTIDITKRTVDNIEAWVTDMGEKIDKHEGRFVKMSKEVSFLKKKKLEEIKKAEEESAKKDLEIENPPAVNDLPVPAEEKKEDAKPEVSEDSGKTSDSGKTVMVGKAMPEVDNDSESNIKITIRKIKK